MARARRSWVKRCDVRLSASSSYHAPKQWSARANRTFDDRNEYRARARERTDGARASAQDGAHDEKTVIPPSADIDIPSCE